MARARVRVILGAGHRMNEVTVSGCRGKCECKGEYECDGEYEYECESTGVSVRAKTRVRVRVSARVRVSVKPRVSARVIVGVRRPSTSTAKTHNERKLQIWFGSHMPTGVQVELCGGTRWSQRHVQQPRLNNLRLVSG